MSDLKLSTTSLFEVNDYGMKSSDISFIKKRTNNRLRASNISGSMSQLQKIRIRIPQSDELLDLKSAFFQMKVKVSDTSGSLGEIRISESGMSSCIRELKVSDGKGTILSRVNNYNVIAKMKQLYMSDHYKHNVLTLEGAFKNPSLPDNYVEDEGDEKKYDLLTGALTFTTGSQNVTGTSTKFVDEIKKNQTLLYEVSGKPYTVEVDSVTDDTNLVLKSNPPIDGANVEQAYLVRAAQKQSEQKLVAQSDEVGGEYFHRPYGAGFFQAKQYWPLIVSGLEIELTLESNTLVFDKVKSNTTKYEIEDLHMVYQTYTPNSEVIASIQQQYITKGLNFTYNDMLLVERLKSTPETKVREDFSESISLLKKVHVFQRPFDYNAVNFPSFQFESFGDTFKNFYLEINRVRVPQWGNEDGFSQPMLYMQNLINSEKLDDSSKASVQSIRDFLEANQQVICLDLERFPEGQMTGASINDQLVRLSMDDLPSSNRALSVVFEHTVFCKLKSGDQIKVMS